MQIMAVYYQFKSSIVKESISVDGPFITVRSLKEKIIDAKKLRRGNYDLVVINPHTNEDYLDEGTLINRCATVLIRRVPRRPLKPIVLAPVPKPNDQVKTESENVSSVSDSSAIIHPEDLEWDEFVKDFCAKSENLPAQSRLGNQVQDDVPPVMVEGGLSRRMKGGRGVVRGGMVLKTPPQGYVCHRCKVPGHFIQHCPTNGDPDYDIKRLKNPTGVPRSMLVTSTDGSYVLQSGAVAILKPNEAAFEKEIEGLPSTNSYVDLPPELRCPLCKQVMKDAVFTSACCFESFCDKCIREHVITKSMCICGAKDMLADYLIPNKTLRDIINGYINGKSSGKNCGRSCNPKPTAASSTNSVASKREQVPFPAQEEENPKVHKVLDKGEAVSAPLQVMEKLRLAKVVDASVSEAEHESMRSSLTDEEVEPKPFIGEAAEKKRKKKAKLGVANTDMTWGTDQDLAAENYMMSMCPGPATYNPYWTGMDAYRPLYAAAIPYMGFGLGPLENIPFGGVLEQHPYGGQSFMMSSGASPRDIVNVGMEFKTGEPLLSREELKDRKANVKRKREVERCGKSRGSPEDPENGREVSSSGDISSMELKSKAVPLGSSSEHHHHRQRLNDPKLPPPSLKRKSDHNAGHPHRISSSSYQSAAEKKKHGGSSLIGFPAEDQTAASKKKKLSSSSDASNITSGTRGGPWDDYMNMKQLQEAQERVLPLPLLLHITRTRE